MTFTVTYRGRDGAPREELVEADSRARCVAECKRRGLVPTSISAGRAQGCRHGGESPSRRSLPPSGKAAVLAAALAAAIGVWWWLGGGRGMSVQPGDAAERVKPAHAEKPSPKPMAKPEKAQESPTESAAAAVRHEEKTEALPPWKDCYVTNRALRLKYSTLIAARTNEGGVVTERFRLPNGTTWRRVSDPPPIFDNLSDNAIAMALGDASGAPVPPVPGLDDANLDEEFARSLDSPIEIRDGDKPGVAAMKMVVREVRKEIAELKERGDTRSVGEILQEHIDRNNHSANMRGDALRQMERVRREDGDAAAAEYLAKVNEALVGFGVAPIELDLNDEGEGKK